MRVEVSVAVSVMVVSAVVDVTVIVVGSQTELVTPVPIGPPTDEDVGMGNGAPLVGG